MADEAFEQVFRELRGVLTPYEARLVMVTDSAIEYYLDRRHVQKNKKPLFFGSVKRGKAYVSFYLMPVYVFPELLDCVSPELRKRMQGKSCFNFKRVDPVLVDELRRLVDAGFRRFEREGWV